MEITICKKTGIRKKALVGDAVYGILKNGTIFWLNIDTHRRIRKAYIKAN